MSMPPVQRKYFLIDLTVIVCAIIAILIAMFCPSLKTHCPECGHVPTIYQAQNTSFCPECGTCYDLAELDGRCLNCGGKCKTAYCPHCGAKQELEE